MNAPAVVGASAAARQLPIYCVERTDRRCSISFDAAWGADNTQRILDVLDEYGVKGTFFVVGNWADQYPDVPQRDILLTGKSGLGKTYLMHAMANRLAERGIQVLMISAYQFFQLARKAYFEGEDVPEEIMESPILMLDDVGSEPLMKNVTVEQLFNVINERRNHGRSTILSTNLNLEEFRERYTERIASRISDPRNSLTIPLEGAVLRKAGK